METSDSTHPPPDRRASRRRWFWRSVATVLSLLLVVPALVFWTGAPPTAPVVQGQPLDFWVRELIAGTKERHDRAAQVIVAEGGTHVDWLVKILNHRPSLAGRLLLRADDWLPRRLSARWHRRLRPYEVAVDRAGAARALGLVGDSSPKVIAALENALRPSDLRLGGEAVASLGQLGPAGTSRLLALLPDLPEAFRLIAISGIVPSNTTAKVALPAILGGALREQNRGVLPAYGFAIARFGREAVGPAYAALRGLDAGATERLIELAHAAASQNPGFLLAWEEQWSSQPAAARSVGLQVFLRLQAHGTRRAIFFARGVCDPDARVRELGRQGLTTVRERARRAVPVLVAGLESDSAEIQLAAIRALGQLGPVAGEAKAPLEALAAGEPSNLRQAAVEALTLIKVSLPAP